MMLVTALIMTTVTAIHIATKTTTLHDCHRTTQTREREADDV